MVVPTISVPTVICMIKIPLDFLPRKRSPVTLKSLFKTLENRLD